jgi:exonuclease VII small subunit
MCAYGSRGVFLLSALLLLPLSLSYSADEECPALLDECVTLLETTTDELETALDTISDYKTLTADLRQTVRERDDRLRQAGNLLSEYEAETAQTIRITAIKWGTTGIVLGVGIGMVTTVLIGSLAP